MNTKLLILPALVGLAVFAMPARAQSNGDTNGEETFPIPAEAAAALAELIPIPETGNGSADDNGPAGPGGATNETFHREAQDERARLAPLRGANSLPGAWDIAPPTPPDQVVRDGEAGLRLNFRGAPLEMVLNYLSDAAGFVIVSEADIRGRVDIVSAQPLTKDEAVDLLASVLGKNGYAVLREGRTLTILTREEARKRDIPVRAGAEPDTIPRNDQIVTQIIPVRFINAVQLARDLAPLIPSSATMTANEGGNALVVTDTQTSIRRLAEIIQALDTTVSSLSSVRVFALRYADARTAATMIREVFAPPEAARQGAGRRGERGEFRFGGGGEQTAAGGRPGAARVVATADDRSNALVVSAPDDLMPTIEQLVASVDTNVEDVTEIRVFRLEHADPQETAGLVTSLFPDTATQQSQQRGGGFRGFGGGGADGQAAGQTTRLMRQSRVLAVPDHRTRSVVVTAARETMTQIESMVRQLDSDPARQQRVFVFEVQNTDPTTVQQTLDSLFTEQGAAGTARSGTAVGQAGTQLTTRAQRQNQNVPAGNPAATGFGAARGATRGFGN